MGVWWNSFGTLFSSFLFLVLVSEIRQGWSLNAEGLALLGFRGRVDSDPHDALTNWNPYDIDPCMWAGVYCNDGKVKMLNLSGLSLKGTLAPELGLLSHIRSLVLYKNRFSGTIPKELGGLVKLELLDLRGNSLSGTIPAEIGGMLSLKRLLLSDNHFEGDIPLELRRLNLLSESQIDEDIIPAMSSGNGDGTWLSSFREMNMVDSLTVLIKAVIRYLNSLQLPKFKFRDDSHHRCTYNCYDVSRSSETHGVRKLASFVRRRLLELSVSINMPALPAPAPEFPSDLIIILPTSRSSGGFPAVSNGNKISLSAPAPSPDVTLNIALPPVHQTNPQPPAEDTSITSSIWERFIKHFIVFLPLLLLLIVGAVVGIMLCRRGVKATCQWEKTGLSGQLQKAFITGVPKLNRSELETACEDFSNIIFETLDGCVIYKGTLSSGVEIAVASVGVQSLRDWSNNSEKTFREKIDTLSRVNHKNFVNLIGYCAENEPFTRMMVFEYAPCGTLFEHLHVLEVDHLDWRARMRIIMGTAYCLQHIHHDLNPPVAITNLNSLAIGLTEDYAAKVADIIFSPKVESKSKITGEEDYLKSKSNSNITSVEENFEVPPLVDRETNVYSFGILLLEIITGIVPYSKENGSIVDWAAPFLSNKKSLSSMIDPTLKCFGNDELEVLCEVIRGCIKRDPRQRPTMKEIVSKLRDVLSISPEEALPRLSPLWWAELEIISLEAA